MNRVPPPSSRLALLAAAALLASGFAATAIDPLPPELENASLAEQSAWRERMGRESRADKEQMARKRHLERTAYKTNFAAALRDEASSVIAATRSPAEQPTATEEMWAESSGKLRGVAIFAGLLSFGFVARRVLGTGAEGPETT